MWIRYSMNHKGIILEADTEKENESGKSNTFSDSLTSDTKSLSTLFLRKKFTTRDIYWPSLYETTRKYNWKQYYFHASTVTKYLQRNGRGPGLRSLVTRYYENRGEYVAWNAWPRDVKSKVMKPWSQEFGGLGIKWKLLCLFSSLGSFYFIFTGH